MMSKLGFILDIPNNRVAISALSCEVQLVNLDGNMAIDIMQFPKAPELKIAESFLVDKEVNFLSDDQAVEEQLQQIGLPDAAARSTSHSSAATSFKTSVKSSVRSHGHRKCSHRVMAFDGGPTPPSPEEDADPAGSGMEVGNGARRSLRDPEFVNNQNSNQSSSGYLLGNNRGTKGQLPTGDALSQSRPVPSSRLSEVRQCMGQVHQVQSLSPKVEVERKAKRISMDTPPNDRSRHLCPVDSNGWSLGAAVNQLSSGGDNSRTELCLPAIQNQRPVPPICPRLAQGLPR